MRVLVVRHAIALDRSEWKNKNDDLRPATAQGLKKFSKAALGLIEMVECPEFHASSSLIRAVQTSQILKKIWGVPKASQWVELRPDANPEATLRKLAQIRSKTVVLVSHEPFLSRFLALSLSSDSSSAFVLRKGGAALIEFSGRVKPCSARLRWMMTPRQLREMAKT